MARSFHLRDLRLQSKFRLMLGMQMMMLLLLSGMGWWALGQFEKVQAQTELRAPQLQVLANLRFRMTHFRGDSLAMMVSASKSSEMQRERVEKTASIQKEVDAVIEAARQLDLPPEQRGRMDRAIRAHQGYVALVKASEAMATGDRDGGKLSNLFALGKAEIDTSRNELSALFKDIQSQSHEESIQAKALMGRLQIIMGSIVLAAFGLGLWISGSIGRHVGTSVQDIDQAMAALARGDLTCVPAAQGGDELGDIARNLGGVIGKLRQDMQSIASISERTASGSTELAATADQLNSTTREISQDVEAQRVAMDQSTRSLAEVSRSVGEVRDQAAEVGHVSEDALSISAQGLAEAEVSQRAMDAIEESSAKVGRITTVIADIARQTNLLSLNAAIEAAKAGAQGKGFAVVAEEIRKLAERSGAAAKEINELIQESTERVGAGTSAVGSVNRALQALEAALRNNSERVQAIIRATEEQARGAEEVVDAVATSGQLTERSASATTQLASSLQETARTIDDLAQTANQLRDLTGRFKLA